MQARNLTEGNIIKQISTLALPIMATGFIQMSYQLLDMFWLGQGTTDWVAAAGMAGYAVWVANALVLIPRIGTEIGVGQAVGAKDTSRQKRYIQGGLMLACVLSVAYAILSILLSPAIIAFFGIEKDIVNAMGIDYLRIVSLGHPFAFYNAVMTGILTAGGDSKTPFIFNTMGLIGNMILDPILIFTFDMGVAGAAWATISAQGIISILFLIRVMRHHPLFHNVFDKWELRMKEVSRIVRWGLPSALQSIFFAVSSAIVSRFVAGYGSGAFAAYNIGVQIESIGWLTMSGFSGALTAFIAQNFGAKRFDRLRTGLKQGTVIGIAVGIFAMTVLIIFAKPFIGLFVGDDQVAAQAGALYLVITALSQVPMSLDFTASGVFQGMGNTIIPSAGGIFGNALRIPLAMILGALFGLGGIFASIAITCAIKGFVLYPWVWKYVNRASRQHGYTID